MKKMFETIVMIAGIVFSGWKMGLADTSTPPLSSVSSQFSTSFLAHITAADVFRQDGSRIVKFGDGIIQAVPYKNDHLFVGAFGLIPHPEDATRFYKSYSIHVHLVSVISKYLDINPTYAPILQDIEFTPGYSYDTDVGHGQLDFSVGYAHQFGSN